MLFSMQTIASRQLVSALQHGARQDQHLCTLYSWDSVKNVRATFELQQLIYHFEREPSKRFYEDHGILSRTIQLSCIFSSTSCNWNYHRTIFAVLRQNNFADRRLIILPVLTSNKLTKLLHTIKWSFYSTYCCREETDINRPTMVEDLVLALTLSFYLILHWL